MGMATRLFFPEMGTLFTLVIIGILYCLLPNFYYLVFNSFISRSYRAIPTGWFTLQPVEKASSIALLLSIDQNLKGILLSHNIIQLGKFTSTLNFNFIRWTQSLWVECVRFALTAPFPWKQIYSMRHVHCYPCVKVWAFGSSVEYSRGIDCSFCRAPVVHFFHLDVGGIASWQVVPRRYGAERSDAADGW